MVLLTPVVLFLFPEVIGTPALRLLKFDSIWTLTFSICACAGAMCISSAVSISPCLPWTHQRFFLLQARGDARSVDPLCLRSSLRTEAQDEGRCEAAAAANQHASGLLQSTAFYPDANKALLHIWTPIHLKSDPDFRA